MSARKPAILFIAAAATSLAMGAEPIYTDPVGFVKMGDPSAGLDDGAGGTIKAVPANTDVFLCIPLEAELAFSGTIASWDKGSNQITVSGTPGWAANSWTTDVPYSVIISSGAESGLRGLITANGDSSVTFTQTTLGDLDNLTVGDSIEIRKCWTVSTLFANSNLEDLCEIKTYFRTLKGINQSTSTSFTYYAGVWYDSFGPADNAILYPGELIVFRSTGSGVENLAVFGDVATFNQRNEIIKDIQGEVPEDKDAEDLHLGTSLPIPRAIGALDLHAENLDTVSFYNNRVSATGTKKSVSQILTFYDGNWYDSFGVADSFEVPPGVGFVYRRHQDSTGASLEWNEPAP